MICLTLSFNTLAETSLLDEFISRKKTITLQRALKPGIFTDKQNSILSIDILLNYK